MLHRDIVVVGASAGGVEALQRLTAMLPADLPAAVFVTIHFPEHGTSVLPRILGRRSPLTVVRADDGDSIVPGRVYVSPPDVHLLISRRGVRLVRGPRENGNRPAIDPMFRSAALAFGPRVIAVLLTGNLDDGTSGIRSIKRAGGVALVQDPSDALFPSMPLSAIEHAEVDRVLPLDDIAPAIAELTSEPISESEYTIMSDDVKENALSAADLGVIGDPEHHPGAVSPFACPDCGGVLWEIREGEFTRFRCRVGHAWTGAALLAQQADDFDDAMWAALRVLEENAALSRHIASRHRRRGADEIARRFERQAESREMQASVIRHTLLARGERAEPQEADATGPRRAS